MEERKRQRCRGDTRKEEALCKVFRWPWALRIRAVTPWGPGLLSDPLLIMIMTKIGKIRA